MPDSETKKTKPVCRSCQSDDVVFDATARWDAEKQEYTHADTFDHVWCQHCGWDSNYADWVSVEEVTP